MSDTATKEQRGITPSRRKELESAIFDALAAQLDLFDALREIERNQGGDLIGLDELICAEAATIHGHEYGDITIQSRVADQVLALQLDKPGGKP